MKHSIQMEVNCMDVKLAASSAARSEHDIDPHNFIIHKQIILKFYLQVYLECSFA